MTLMDKAKLAGETLGDLGDLIRKLDSIAEVLTLETNRQSELITLMRGPLANNVIWDGTIQLDAGGRATKSFGVPFASMLVADANGVGPLIVSTEPNDGVVGVGTAPVPFGAAATVPFTGRQFYISGGKANGTVYVAVFSIPKDPFFAQLVSSAGASSGPVSVAANVASVTLKAANAARSGLIIVNTDAASNLFVSYGAVATTALYTVKLVPGAYWEMPQKYAGVVAGIWDGAPTGAALVTETT